MLLHEMTHLNQYQKHGNQMVYNIESKDNGGEIYYLFFLMSKGKRLSTCFNDLALNMLNSVEFQANCPIANGLLEVNKVLFEQGVFIPGGYEIGCIDLKIHKGENNHLRYDLFPSDCTPYVKSNPFLAVCVMEYFKTQLYLGYDYFKEKDEEFLNELVCIVMDVERHIKEILEI